MRPALLDPLFAEAASLPGVGPKVEKLLARVTGVAEGPPLVRDLLFHLPVSAIARQQIASLDELPQQGHVVVTGKVEHHEAPRRHSRAPYRVILDDGRGTVELIFFNIRSQWIEKILPLGATRTVSGRLDWFDYRAQIVHPEVMEPGAADKIQMVEPIYPLTEGLSSRVLGKIIRAALERAPTLPEWITSDLMAREKWPSLTEALATMHRPQEAAALLPEAPAWRRLAFDELLASQLALGLVRRSARKTAGKARHFSGDRAAKLHELLPFALTQAQQDAVTHIRKDLRSPERMLRLLQGDVGSGKTLVALTAMLDVSEDGGQAALMAPTEILARQHFATIAPLAESIGLTTALFTGKDIAGRGEKLAALAAGDIDIAIGTHALFQESVTFKDLGLVIVDEQHRFGVHQRMLLSAKGSAPDLLVMTATPIPRTLVLTYFGDMEISELREKPAGRRPIDTRVAPSERLAEVKERIRSAVDKGEKVYWVCPLVEESESLDVAAAEERFRDLEKMFGSRALLLHGRMKAAEKAAAMQRFREAGGAVLVATTVIEVGVDVPDASIIVIEHAERFGLAQLHQLRGRVGRGDKPSSCLLLYKPPLSETARERLKVMRETNDGFVIAEADLKLRGEGDLLGTRQSGMPGFRLARPEFHGDLLALARDEAKLILAREEKGGYAGREAVRCLLYLFGRDEAIRLMRSG
ncbi:ATP-dependent DNA helicase RecG [Afifella sp. JA880]|uniref:ATP-dependent DNA helicase RecG n=1 Tax=Afifella sp. JA880 TaxID=2975280 RepID=UPI0021BA7735|nr:ATP-dependent DNA helicase RecG [Afifella sp. JA880]MCT8265810.1 ATP-dependent DNA helicase RecG [Afifella sp. JA880]